MEDSPITLRVKFMTRPENQWLVRYKVFARIRETFEREGIRFAHREIAVRIADHDAREPLNNAEMEAAAAAARPVVEPAEAAAVAPAIARRWVSAASTPLRPLPSRPAASSATQVGNAGRPRGDRTGPLPPFPAHDRNASSDAISI